MCNASERQKRFKKDNPGNVAIRKQKSRKDNPEKTAETDKKSKRKIKSALDKQIERFRLECIGPIFTCICA